MMERSPPKMPASLQSNNRNLNPNPLCHPLDDILYLRNMKIMNGWIFYPIGSMGRLYMYLHDLADFFKGYSCR